ncbi:MAG: DEAD/DEAH box helicase family protein [Thaumarchaeota archaeon]|nr:DEAD/DEAH box helicase family protein [Nitrososphaerota archaeon]
MKNNKQKYILRTPYDEPISHLELDEKGRTTDNILTGRRPSEASVCPPGKDGIIVDATKIEPHKSINELRHTLKIWREDNWNGITTDTRKLLNFWHNLESESKTHPFWCQLEAVETIIWLFEAGHKHNQTLHEKVWNRIKAANNKHNEGIPRLAFKMATGSGKTNVMSMAMLWMLVNNIDRDDDGGTHFLIIAPNHTVRERLKVLVPDPKKEPWASITPKKFYGVLNSAKVRVVNFQAFQNRTVMELGTKEKRLLGRDAENMKESDTDMINRILRGHGRKSQIIVINDEGHHCYRPSSIPAHNEEDEDAKTAAVWFNALRLLKGQGRLARVYDFSATPIWISTPDQSASDVFPWTVSDFPLLDAIESGLVKIPRIPVDDDIDTDNPKYRNVYDYNGGKPLTTNLVERVGEPLRQLYRHYHDVVNPAYGEVGIIPVFIIVANNIKNAAAIYRWVAGSRGACGHLDLFSNYDQNGDPKKCPPTLLVHSRLFEKTPTHKLEKGMVGEQATLFGLKGSLDEKQEQIRALFTSVGKGEGRAGHIRCVISVGMLTEGWDAKNVTHVFGYRKFDSQLLCEQVTGRALRRTSFSGLNEIQKPEYASMFGVPYTFARGGNVDPQPAAQEYRVFSVPCMEKYRMSFPNVVGYKKPYRRMRFKLDPDKVKSYVVDTTEPTETTSGGATGESLVTRRGRRPKTAIWKTADALATILVQDTWESDGEPYAAVGRQDAFLDSLRIVTEWLDHDSIRCEDIAGMAADDKVPQQIADACRHDAEDVGGGGGGGKPNIRRRK